MVGERSVLVGSAAWLESRGIAVPAIERSSGASVVHVAIDGRHAGSFEARDQVRAEAFRAVRELAATGIESSLLSGDAPAATHRAAHAAGIADARVLASLTPEAKCAAITHLSATAGPVAMIGDGVNDAPALAAADLGIALGTGADVALEAADVAIVAPDLALVPAALAHARRTLRIVRQNLAWAIGYNAIAIPLAAAGVLHPIVAAGAMALSSVSVLANSQRLRHTP